MSNPTPPTSASPRPVWALAGLVVVAALVVATLVASVRAGVDGPEAASLPTAPAADFASFEAPDEGGSPEAPDEGGLSAELRWPSAAEFDALVAEVNQKRWERFVASLPPAPEPEPEPEPVAAPAPAPVPAPAPAPAPAPEPEPAPEPAPVVDAAQAPAVPSDSVWDALAVCESSGNWAMNSGNGFYGGIQFMHSTWVNMGGRQWAEYPHQATREQQIEVATRLQAQYGWGQWPACSARLGLR